MLSENVIRDASAAVLLYGSYGLGVRIMFLSEVVNSFFAYDILWFFVMENGSLNPVHFLFM